MRAKFEVADVLRKHWPEVEQHPKINSWQLRTLGAIKRCRTAELGGHIDSCSSCGQIRSSYNSCRNRHCPKCQGKKREDWIKKREEELLPVPYFHVVFTLPDLLNPLALHKPKEVYDTLFETAWDVIKTFGRDPKHLGAETGMICILHTWGQQLTLHPHLHCIVPGGGLTKAGFWKTAKSNGKFLFPVKSMSKRFRTRYIENLKAKGIHLEKSLVNSLYKNKWVVYAKKPFKNPTSVIEYLGRYTHKIAISNHRITNFDKDGVSFTYKDYKQEGKKLVSTLDPIEFIRRFSIHVLPKGFVRIRHFGILSGTSKKVTIPKVKEQLPEVKFIKKEKRKLKEFNPRLCPCCKTETMVTIEVFDRRGPPAILINKKHLSSKPMN